MTVSGSSGAGSRAGTQVNPVAASVAWSWSRRGEGSGTRHPCLACGLWFAMAWSRGPQFPTELMVALVARVVLRGAEVP
jgi:hypothetical protein